MKKIKIQEKKLSIIIFFLIFITSLSVILLKQLNDLDELWNYNFARNVARGLIPYRDFNMVVTPLFSLVSGFLLKITTDKMIVMRIFASGLMTLVLYVIYKICNLLNIKKEICIIYLGLIFLLFQNIISFDYNWLTLLLVLIVLYSELKKYKQDNNILKNNLKHDIFVGIIAGMTIMCKQTIGIMLTFVFLMNKVIFVRNRDDIKIFLKCFIYRSIGILIPNVLCFVYLITNNAFYEFINYTIKGTKEFSNFYSYINLIRFDAIGILAILTPLMILLETVLLIMKKRNMENYFILIYSLAMIIVIFPISDVIHFIIGITPALILLLYELYRLLYNILYEKRKIFKIISVYISTFIVIFACYYAINNFYTYIKCRSVFSNIEQYQGIIISERLRKRIEEVDRYMLNSKKDIKILDSSAVTYMIPINRYNKDYDMFNKGNFGENGENRLIEDIKTSKNRQYLLLNDNYILNWQTPVKIIENIKKNMRKVGEVSIFDVYE